MKLQQRCLVFLADGLPDRLIHVDRRGVAHVRLWGYIVATLIVLFAMGLVAGVIFGRTSGARDAEGAGSQSLPAERTNVLPNEKERNTEPQKKDKILVYRRSATNVIGVIE